MSFEPTVTSWSKVPKILASIRRAILCGPPGTGKSTAAYKAASLANWRSYTMTMTPNMMASELLAMYVPRPTPNGPEFVMQLSPAGQALAESTRKSPCLLILNEIDRASEDALTMLYMIADSGAGQQHTLPNGDVLTDEDGSLRIIATTNVTELDTFPAGILSRFPVILRLDEINPDALETLGGDARRLAETPDATIHRGLGIRPFQAFDEFLKAGMSAQEAAEILWGVDQAQEIARALEVANITTPPVDDKKFD